VLTLSRRKRKVKIHYSDDIDDLVCHDFDYFLGMRIALVSLANDMFAQGGAHTNFNRGEE